jgi:hypothetical protein
MMRVLPAIETYPLLDETERTAKYAYYEIEGQTNGRLRCLKKFSKGYVPHAMGPDVQTSMKPRGYNLGFICPDVKYCEIAVLQWLSGDSKLKTLLESDEDLV